MIEFQIFIFVLGYTMVFVLLGFYCGMKYKKTLTKGAVNENA